MQIGVASSSTVGIPVLRSLLSSHHIVDFVLTNPQKQRGRGLSLASNEFHTFAEDQGIEILAPSSSSELFSALQGRNIDLIVTIAYGQLIKTDSLALPKYGWLNVHFSQLPRWRGASPVQSAILAGDSEIGISIFQLEEGMDTGPIYFRSTEQIYESDTTSIVLERLSHLASQEVSPLLDRISTGFTPQSQQKDGVTYARKFLKEDGRLDPKGSSIDFLRKIRALGENPGTTLEFRGEKLKVDEAAKVVVENISLPSASLMSTKKALYLVLSDGVVELIRVTPAGKRSMGGADFARGARIVDGDFVE